jgi:putative DNA modification/repair radical SAM protein
LELSTGFFNFLGNIFQYYLRILAAALNLNTHNVSGKHFHTSSFTGTNVLLYHLGKELVFVDVFEKLKILTSAAKYDVACTSSGANKKAVPGGIGSASPWGICHSFAGDGRCISLLKLLMTNVCINDCKYCVNRCSNDIQRTFFTPRELADLTINFYRRNYIEGLFLSSGVINNADYTCEQMIETLRILREEYRFSGYIHAKAVPGADTALVAKLGMLADRISVNIELPSQRSLQLLAPDKPADSILTPMEYICHSIQENISDRKTFRHAPRFAPAGQSTQMIIGATPDTDYQILRLSHALYKKYRLKRVFYSAYIPVSSNTLLPPVGSKPPLLREHRLYQADWLLRFYGFSPGELLDKQNPNFNPFIDPKCNWALNHMEFFPIEVNRASYQELLRVPGIGVTGAKRIISTRRTGALNFDGLKKLGIVLKRAQYFITCGGRTVEGLKFSQDEIPKSLLSKKALSMYNQGLPLQPQPQQLSLFDEPLLTEGDNRKCLTGRI